MKLFDFMGDVTRHYDGEETSREFVPLRDAIFDCGSGHVSFESDRILRNSDWTSVIIRGSWWASDRSDDSDVGEFYVNGCPCDPRDELQPLFDILQEDGVEEIIHLRPYWNGGIDPEFFPLGYDAVGEQPGRDEIRIGLHESYAQADTDRLILDRTGRWGFYCDVEHFGLLGGEPELMKRYVEKAGGWDFIRQRADAYWQWVVDTDNYEAPWVPDYYRVAGWGDPPVKRTG